MSSSFTANVKTMYTDEFYTNQIDGSYSSAACVLPLVLGIMTVNSAIDVGCGVGAWSSRLLECGVTDVLGIDGDYVNPNLLRIPATAFQACNLNEPIRMNRKFDLALCLEVAEHLPPERAEGLVTDLVNLAPVVLFSAAIPGQYGTNHINRRYLSYWVKLFARSGYVLVDVLRPALWNEEKCDWWYRQNAVLFVQERNPLSQLQVPTGIDYVHPCLYAAKYREAELNYILRIARLMFNSFSRILRACFVGSHT